MTTLNREIFIKDLDRDEMRNGFLVTSQRKKLWNVQIGLINEFVRICRKHNLRWFAINGTLLGAARHKGFIPWDDDVDVAMFRPDYEKFQAIAADEVKAPYFADIWYNYRLESEGASLDDAEGDFQFITLEQEKESPNSWISQWESIRLRDSRTLMLEYVKNFTNQGIWIDIFPLDPVPPFDKKETLLAFEKAKILYLIAATPAKIRRLMRDKKIPFNDYDVLEKFLNYPYKKRGELYSHFMSKNFFTSERVGKFFTHCLVSPQESYSADDFADMIYLPFEKIEVPAPAGYNRVLTDYYGDWHKFVIAQSHSAECSVDISFKEYYRKSFHFKH